MSKWLLALLLFVSSCVAGAEPLVDGPAPVLVIYADSRWDNGAVDATDYDNFLPSWLKKRSFAHVGADIPLRIACNTTDTIPLFFTNNDCVGSGNPYACCTGSGTGNCPLCQHLGGRAIQQGGACYYQPSNWRTPTCITDQVGDSASYAEIFYIDYGVNDAQAYTDVDTSGWTGRVSQISDTFDDVVSQMPSTSPCVLAVTFPTYHNNSSFGTTYQVLNQRINEDIRPIVEAAARAANCAVADLYSAMVTYEATAGEAAMLSLYNNCSAKGGESPTQDCIHLDKNNAIGEDHPLGIEIMRAINEAMSLKPARWPDG